MIRYTTLQLEKKKNESQLLKSFLLAHLSDVSGTLRPKRIRAKHRCTFVCSPSAFLTSHFVLPETDYVSSQVANRILPRVSFFERRFVVRQLSSLAMTNDSKINCQSLEPARCPEIRAVPADITNCPSLVGFS